MLAAGVGRDDLFRLGSLNQIGDFFAAAAHPRVDAAFLGLTAHATLTTLAYAVLGTALSLAIGLVGGILTSETWWSAGARGRRRPAAVAGWVVARVALVVPRGIHEVVWGLLLLSLFGIQPIVAVLAIGIPFGAVTAKVFSEILDETSRGPYTALLAAGAGRRSAIIYGLLPPALADMFSYSFYRFECAIRSAAILGLIGAGGLGFQLALSFQSLRYSEIWTILYALIALSAGADMWGAAVRARRAAPRRKGVRGRDRLLSGSAAVAPAMVPLAAWWVGLDPAVLWAPQTWEIGHQLLAEAWPPTLGAVDGPGLARLALATLAMSVLAMGVAFVGGMLFAIPAANLTRLEVPTAGGRVGRIARLLLYAITRVLLIVLRAIPPPIWALLLLFVFYPGLLPGALALAIYTIGVLGRLMAETAENLDRRPLRALRAHGTPELQVFCYGVVPSAMPRFVAYGLYRWEVSIRETVVVGVVGAGGLGLLLDQQLAAFDYSSALTTLLVFMLLPLIVDFTSAAVRRSLR
jgi:phosphonate transport system permease protein